MALRQSPESYFATRQNVQTQEPIPVTQTLQTTEPVTLAIDPNLALVLGIAIIGFLGLIAYLASRK